MPEILEIELYRHAMEPIVGRTIVAVDAPDAWYLKRGLTAEELDAELPGRRISGLRRRAKLLVVDLEDGPPVLGLRFGMTGRPYVDDAVPFDLEYGASRDHAGWDRFVLRFTDGGTLRLNDPRRLGGVELDPDLDRIGPDALTLTLGQLRDALAGSSAPIKAALLDQGRIGGLGNLLADEVLFRAGLDPARPAGSLSPKELAALHRAVRRVLPQLLERGGSHLGEFASAMRQHGAVCPRDGTPMVRRTIGGRTSYACPAHQR